MSARLQKKDEQSPDAWPQTGDRARQSSDGPRAAAVGRSRSSSPTPSSSRSASAADRQADALWRDRSDRARRSCGHRCPRSTRSSIAPGKLITTKPTIIVQPLETSIIRSIDVAAATSCMPARRLRHSTRPSASPTSTSSAAKFAAFDAQVKRHRGRARRRRLHGDAARRRTRCCRCSSSDSGRAFYVAQLQNFEQQIAGQAATIDAARTRRSRPDQPARQPGPDRECARDALQEGDGLADQSAQFARRAARRRRQPGATARQGGRGRACHCQAPGRPAGLHRGFSPRRDGAARRTARASATPRARN